MKQREAIDWVFEGGTTGSVQINHMMNAMYTDVKTREDFRIKGWSFGGKNVLPLQAPSLHRLRRPWHPALVRRLLRYYGTV